MKEKFVKAKQYKNFGYIAVAIVAVYICLMILRNKANNENLQASRHYTKKISTGADGLSEQELWIEKSTNEIEEIRNLHKKLDGENQILQKQIEELQKIVIGLGVSLSTDQSNKAEPKSTLEHTDPQVLEQSTDSISIENLENFSEQRGVLRYSNGEGNYEKQLANDRVLKSGIKVIKFNNTDSEYDLSENFIFAGTYARAVLTGSVVASAGIGASSNPEPVLLRITDFGNLPNNVKGFLKDAVVIGAAYGDLSSESVVIRLERIVKIDSKTGVGVDIPVKGYVAGENGSSRIRGIVFDRAGKVARNSAISGFLSGIADYVSINNNTAFKFEPNSGLAQFSPQAGAKMLQQGASKGIGNAVEKYADFIIKRAEQMQPVIMIDGGRKLTIVFTDSVKASAVHLKKVRKELYVRKQY